jgi:acyl-CoA hydrolase
MTNKHIGSSFDEFLEEEGILAETNAVAIKRVVAWQIQQKNVAYSPQPVRQAKIFAYGKKLNTDLQE